MPYVTLQDLCEEGQCKSSQHGFEYKFYDPEVLPNGTIAAKAVNYNLKEVAEKTYNLGYKYDDTPMIQPPSKRLLAESGKPSAPSALLASQEVGKVVESNHSIDLQLSLKPQVETELRRLRGNNASIPTATKGFRLEIDVTYAGRPYSSYGVFLNLPDEESKREIDAYYAGSISFFVVPSPKPVTKTFQFDITDELLLQIEKLGEKRDSENLSISIQKTSGSEDEAVKIERVSLYSY